MPSEWSLEEALLAGNDEILEINSDLRTINVPSGYVFGVFNDKDVFPVLFKMARTYDGQDMSEFQFRINYQNANGEGGNYIVEDKKVETKTIYFSWLLGREVFRGEGQVKFVVCLRKFNTDGSIAKEFNTTIARGTVLSGLEVDDPESDPYKIIGQVDSLEILAQVEDIQKDVDEKAVGVTDRYNDIMQVKRTFGSPLVAATAAEMTETNRVYVYTGSESGYTNGHWYYYQDSKWNDGGVYNSSAINTDTTLKVSGMAADAKAAGDAIDGLKADLNEIEEEIQDIEPLSEDAKTALLNCFAHVAWIDEHGQDYVDALEEALYPETGLVSISAVFNPGSNTIYDTTPLNDLKAYLTVTGHYSDGRSKSIRDYTLSGTLLVGTRTITVTVDNKTTTFNVTVEYMSFEWNYTSGIPQSNGFTQYSSSGTGEMQSNGYLMTANDASDNSYRLYYQWPDFSHEYTKVILEITFILNKWGSYNAAPYTNGIRIEPGLGKINNVTIPNPEFVLNTSGLTSWHPTQSNKYNHDVLNAYNFVVGNEYTVKIELTPENCKIYINDELLATETSEYYNDHTASAIWGVTRGASITVKSYKEQRGVS